MKLYGIVNDDGYLVYIDTELACLWVHPSDAEGVRVADGRDDLIALRDAIDQYLEEHQVFDDDEEPTP